MALKPFPHPELSMWQSAIDKVVATHAIAAAQPQRQTLAQTRDVGAVPAPITRPDDGDGMVAATATMGQYLEHDVSLAQQAAQQSIMRAGPQAQTGGVGDW